MRWAEVDETEIGPLYRIGRSPDPLVWTPWRYTGKGRFDDPRLVGRRYRVLYAGERRVVFLETLANLRVPLDGTPTVWSIVQWLTARRIARFFLSGPRQQRRWLDLRSPATYQFLRQRFATLLLEQGFSDYDVATATTSNLTVIQVVGEWAFEEGFDGIAYLSRLDPSQTCWANFERPDMLLFSEVEIQPIPVDDPDLRYVIELFELPPL